MYKYKVVAWVDLIYDFLRKSGEGRGLFDERYLNFIKDSTQTILFYTKNAEIQFTIKYKSYYLFIPLSSVTKSLIYLDSRTIE